MYKFETHVFLMMESTFSSAIAEGFKKLFEKKHLYQRVDITFPEFQLFYNIVDSMSVGDVRSKENNLQECKRIYDVASDLRWVAESPRSFDNDTGFVIGIPDVVASKQEVSISFTSPTIKVFCQECGDIEPFNLLSATNVLREELDNYSAGTQVFTLIYQCQGCKDFPIVFMVRREKMKLLQNGRSPMETVFVPKFIPKDQRTFFSSAIIAFNSGQVLAGNFLLRTFIEQYVRNVVENSNLKGVESLLDEYASTLPEDFREYYPSLKTIYGTLSIDIHSANGSKKVFLQAREDIETHFDAKRLREVT